MYCLLKDRFVRLTCLFNPKDDKILHKHLHDMQSKFKIVEDNEMFEQKEANNCDGGDGSNENEA